MALQVQLRVSEQSRGRDVESLQCKYERDNALAEAESLRERVTQLAAANERARPVGAGETEDAADERVNIAQLRAQLRTTQEQVTLRDGSAKEVVRWKNEALRQSEEAVKECTHRPRTVRRRHAHSLRSTRRAVPAPSA